MQRAEDLGDDGTNIGMFRRVRGPIVQRPSVKEIPYDHVATFRLQGRAGNRVEDVINISVDGAFVAKSIGYSFIPARLPDRTSDLAALKGALRTIPPPFGLFLEDLFQDPRLLAQCVLFRLCGLDFKYTIIDSAAGRELQNQPVHNVSGLGTPDGSRPFRNLAKPMLFMPRSTIRIVVEEVSEGPIFGHEDPPGSGIRVESELFVVIHGYKILGYGVA